MLSFLPGRFVGVFTLVLGVSGTVVIFLFPVLPCALLKLLIPIPASRHFWTLRMAEGTTLWALWITLCLRLPRQPRRDFQGLEGTTTRGKYLLISNHSAWTDIPVLLEIFPGHMPFPRFFLKQQLIWLPIIGFCAWALDCPFMRRHTQEELTRHPEWRGRDLATTRRSCERLRHIPFTIVNFAEGTRATPAKRLARQSPYRHLLRPKSAGVAFMLNALGDQLDSIVNLTIVYPPGSDNSFWARLCGRIEAISVRVEMLPVPRELVQGDYQNDPEFRERFQAWMTALWDRKEALIDELHAAMTPPARMPCVQPPDYST